MLCESVQITVNLFKVKIKIPKYMLFLQATLLEATPGWNWQKIKQKLSNTLRLNFDYLKIIHILHPRYRPKIIVHTLKNKQKNKCFYIHEIIRLIVRKMKMKKKTRSHRYDIDRPRSRHGHKYSTYKTCLSLIMLMYQVTPKQHLTLNSWKG